MNFLNNILNVLKSFFRSFYEDELERGERLYREKYKNYGKVVSATEALSMMSEELKILKYWYDASLRQTLDHNIFFDEKDGTPYTIIWRVRWNLTDYVLAPNYSRILKRMTLAEYLLPPGAVIIKPLREFIKHSESATVIAISENLPKGKFGAFAD